MIENIDILYNVTGQSLYFDAPEGRPSSVTGSVVYCNSDGDDATAESATTGSAAIETNPDTTFDADSGLGQLDPTALNLAATTGIVASAKHPRRYLATNALGETEWIEVTGVESGATARSRFALRNAYTSGDTLESTRITHAIDSTWVADDDHISGTAPAPDYRWRLEYVVDSVTYVHHIYFDLVRYSGTTTVTPLDVDGAYPWLRWLNRLPTEDQEDRGQRVINEAYRQVKLKLHMAGKADEAARNREIMEDLVIHRAAYLAAGADLEAADVAIRNFNESFDNFIVVPKLEFDNEGDGAAAPSDPSPIWRR